MKSKTCPLCGHVMGLLDVRRVVTRGLSAAAVSESCLGV